MKNRTMNDRTPGEPAADETSPDDEPWLERARAASVTLLTMVERNPHGAFLTGLPVEPWLAASSHPLHPPE